MKHGNRIYLTSIVTAILTILLITSHARAYDEFSHEWITRNALDYLRDHPHFYTETDVWVQKLGPRRGFAEDALVRSVVDTDYRTDMWLEALFHSPFTGADSGTLVTLFTSLFHFVNVTTPGDFWDHDGYAYRHSTKQGNDDYLNYITVATHGQDSTALGGRAPAGDELHGPALGVYNTGFTGTHHEWKKMYKSGIASDAVFPPSTVPAQIAYNAMLQSERAQSDATDAWIMDLPLVTGIFSTKHLMRNYWRGQVAGLPQSWDMLGMAMHLTQDATVPHHVEGTSDNCHPEYEDMVDQVTCGSPTPLDRSAYYDGSYSGYREGCGQLYDAALVTMILGEFPNLAVTANLSVADRMVAVAQISAQWKWRTADGNRYTSLPEGQAYEAGQCSDLFSIQAVMDQTKFQYNLAIAETIALFEKAAHEYESAHSFDPSAQLAEMINLFKGP